LRNGEEAEGKEFTCCNESDSESTLILVKCDGESILVPVEIAVESSFDEPVNSLVLDLVVTGMITKHSFSL